MQVQVMKYLDDEYTEAILKISSGDISLLVYNHPHAGLPQTGDFYLSCFLADNICTENCFSAPVRIDPEGLDYLLVGKVISAEKRLVEIKEIKIYLDIPFPQDIRNGEYVSFSVVRLDFNS